MKGFESYNWWDFFLIQLKGATPEHLSYATKRSKTDRGQKDFTYDLEGFYLELRRMPNGNIAIQELSDDLGADVPLSVGQAAEIKNIVTDKINKL